MHYNELKLGKVIKFVFTSFVKFQHLPLIRDADGGCDWSHPLAYTILSLNKLVKIEINFLGMLNLQHDNSKRHSIESTQSNVIVREGQMGHILPNNIFFFFAMHRLIAAKTFDYLVFLGFW